MEITVELERMKLYNIVQKEMLDTIQELNHHLKTDCRIPIFSTDKKEENRKVRKLRKAAMMIADYYS